MTLLLLRWGANINGFTNSKETALHKCGRWNRLELAKILIKKGAILHYKNSDGNRAMDMTTDPEMMELLNPYKI
jgi:ankyrin repeat protein